MNSIKDKIKEKVNQDDKILLLEKGKRGILNVIFGRSRWIWSFDRWNPLFPISMA